LFEGLFLKLQQNTYKNIKVFTVKFNQFLKFNIGTWIPSIETKELKLHTKFLNIYFKKIKKIEKFLKWFSLKAWSLKNKFICTNFYNLLAYYTFIDDLQISYHYVES